MQTIRRLLLIVTILWVTASPSSAQKNTWQLISLSHDTLIASRLDSLSETTLFATCSGRVISLPIDSIAVLVGFKEGGFWQAAGLGSLVGAATGAIIGAVTYQNQKPSIGGRGADEFGYGLLGAVSGFAVGGIIGASSGHYETYAIWSEKTLKMKQKVLQQAFDN
jgi:hypothetical protein